LVKHLTNAADDFIAVIVIGRVVLGSYFQRSGSSQRSVSVSLRATTTFAALTSAQSSNLLKVIDVVSIN
jgi:hypothetical protein